MRIRESDLTDKYEEFQPVKNMTRLNILIILLLFAVNTSFAQKLRKVSGKALVKVEDTHCIGELKQKIIESAKIDALAKVFGTVVHQGNDLLTENTTSGNSANTNSQFSSISSSEVKGEWVETTKEEVKWVLENEKVGLEKRQVLYLLCNVEGKARALEKTEISLEVLPLKCPSKECATSQFQEGDGLYLNFKSPVDGYLSVFMHENDKVYRLLPYTNMDEMYSSAVPVEGDKNYILFSSQHGGSYFNNSTKREIDEMLLSTEGKEKLFSRIYVVFSTQSFKKPILEEEQIGLKTIAPDEFASWLSKAKSKDRSLLEKVVYITVNQ